MPALSLNSRENLLKIARETLENFVMTGTIPSFKLDDPALLEHRACFVTLRKEGRLRGCVGALTSDKPLYEEVIRMTKAAACEDFRFGPIVPNELKAIKIEISVLSPLEKIHSPKEIEAGRHGIYLKWGDRSGTFLPEVAQEMGWDAEEFVKACAQEKANIPETAWPEVTLYRFTTEKIKEN